MKRTFAASAAITLLTLLTATSGAGSADEADIQIADTRSAARAEDKGVNNIYLVRMRDAPIATYNGGVAGYAATRPAKGKKIDLDSREVARYGDYLKGRHDAAVARVGGARKIYSYSHALNGFAAELSDSQVAQLRASADVVAVTPNRVQKLDTVSTPKFLRLEGPGGAWEQLGGVNNAGEDVVIGIVDSGIWPENPSFSDRTGTGPNGQGGKLNYHQIPGWNARCVPGEQFPASKCNQKLIAARYFTDGVGGPARIKALFPYEYVSARDADGHGSHTASTAGGNNGVPVVMNGVNFGTASGMAPRARIAAYKACWGRTEAAAGCYTADTVAAIDQAVADGVDVINFSISGSTTTMLDPVHLSMLFAAEAGVFVAMSAGNSGPTASTVAHNMPWVTTVAAGTHDRFYAGNVTLGNGAVYAGSTVNITPIGPLPVVLSTAAGVAYSGQPLRDGLTWVEMIRLCYLDTLNAAVVAGKIVVCDRGVNARVEKSEAVAQAGGRGMILANTSPNTLNSDLHSVPTVHVDEIAGAAIKAYAVTPNPTASLSTGTLTNSAIAPDVAGFSSRGPARAAAGDLVKPDIMAPGVDVLAAYSPVNGGQDYAFLQGTSMSSPHIAGIAALFKQRYPNWSPAAIRSALMTTATRTRNNGSPIVGNAFSYGAGQVQPLKALDPGLVYDSGFEDWLGFLCGTGELVAGFCTSLVIDPSDLNYPSIGIGALAGSQTVKRTVTNVSNSAATYSASVEGLAGLVVTVTPSTLTVGAGQSASYTVTFQRTTAALGTYVHGAINWNDGAHVVRSPVAVRPVAMAAPAEVSGTGGPISYSATFGFAGPFTATARGLVAATTTAGTVADDPGDSFSPTGPGVTAFNVVIPSGTTFARFALFDEFTDGNDDLDLYVYQGATFLGGSGGNTSAEQVSFNINPASGPIALTVYVHGFATDGPSANFTFFNWYVPATNAGNFAVSPTSGTATIGGTQTFNLSFSGLTSGVKYLGAVGYAGAAGLAPTVVSVNP